MKALLLGALLSAIIGFAAYKKNALNSSGFAAAVVLGTVVYLCGGLLFWLTMIAFFISSSLLTFIKSSKKETAQRLNEKGGRRDAVQVFANGAPAMAAAILFWFYQNPVFLIIFAASFASSNADTWASEIGVLNRKPPVSIIGFKPMEPGTSGAVSPLGMAAAFAGALFIALVFCLSGGLVWGLPVLRFSWVLIITVSGFLGCLTDSLLGAVVQAQYRCVSCGRLTEKTVHHGENAVLVKGFKVMNNDMVNFLSSLAAGLLGSIFFSFL
ncbi:DUF92 domain-containing protein [Eubacterium sp. 1001713B170207_170306_E7]|uniref:DUF92 domain-containing protein n=1 Tax=Eubacterium sp. 1001713B170207_170306_E7 TaxID=2787097 RepID=UPI001899300D|nr:DUF92 domain-containing protein [Eubacterium sp. 1001713B170207_170306_E7]